MCQLRGAGTLNDAIDPTDKSPNQLIKELNAKCSELETDLKKHKVVVDGLHELLIEA